MRKKGARRQEGKVYWVWVCRVCGKEELEEMEKNKWGEMAEW